MIDAISLPPLASVTNNGLVMGDPEAADSIFAQILQLLNNAGDDSAGSPDPLMNEIPTLMLSAASLIGQLDVEPDISREPAIDILVESLEARKSSFNDSPSGAAELVLAFLMAAARRLQPWRFDAADDEVSTPETLGATESVSNHDDVLVPLSPTPARGSIALPKAESSDAVAKAKDDKWPSSLTGAEDALYFKNDVGELFVRSPEAVDTGEMRVLLSRGSSHIPGVIDSPSDAKAFHDQSPELTAKQEEQIHGRASNLDQPKAARQQSDNHGVWPIDDGQVSQNQGAQSTPLLRTPYVATNLTLNVDDIRGRGDPRSLQVHDLARSVVEQIASRAHLLVARGQVGMEIQLEPKELGKVRVRVSLGSEGLHIRLLAEAHDTRELIKAALPQLRESFASQGVYVDRFDIALASGLADFYFGEGETQGRPAHAIATPQADIRVDENSKASAETIGQESLIDYRI